jgi:ribose 1,5-bisphosphokinase
MSGPPALSQSAADRMGGTEGQRIGPGALVLVVGPSGAGKDTLIGMARAMLADDPAVVFPTRLITRAPDATEASEAVDEADYVAMVARGAVALHWRAHGLGYAVPGSADAAIRRGATVVVNVSRQVIAEALARYARLTVVLVTAPHHVLAARLAGRGRESEADIAARLSRTVESLPAVPNLVVIQNVGDPALGAERLAVVVRDLVAATPRA